MQCTCLYCSTEFTKGRNTFGKYCNNSCQGAYQLQKKIEGWYLGTEKGWSGKTVQISHWLRRHIKDVRGTACSKCGWDEFHPSDGNSLTEIDHIDGDAENCTNSNLQVVCPNCHSMTLTFRARNKDSKRNRK